MKESDSYYHRMSDSEIVHTILTIKELRDIFTQCISDNAQDDEPSLKLEVVVLAIFKEIWKYDTCRRQLIQYLKRVYATEEIEKFALSSTYYWILESICANPSLSIRGQWTCYYKNIATVDRHLLANPNVNDETVDAIRQRNSGGDLDTSAVDDVYPTKELNSAQATSDAHTHGEGLANAFPASSFTEMDIEGSDFNEQSLRRLARSRKTSYRQLWYLSDIEFQPYVGIDISENPRADERLLHRLIDNAPSNKGLLHILLKNIAVHKSASSEVLERVIAMEGSSRLWEYVALNDNANKKILCIIASSKYSRAASVACRKLCKLLSAKRQ